MKNMLQNIFLPILQIKEQNKEIFASFVKMNLEKVVNYFQENNTTYSSNNICGYIYYLLWVKYVDGTLGTGYFS